jgi:multimeric flavodoxin WrbA
MSTQLRVVAINGSPHGAIGNTSQMIRMIGEGLSREGIVLEELFLTDKAIAYCTGCGVCLEKGKCWRKDDHAGITDTLFAADGIILASPVYFKHVTAQMKTFIDRSLAFGHKPRGASKPGLAVFVPVFALPTRKRAFRAGRGSVQPIPVPVFTGRNTCLGGH